MFARETDRWLHAALCTGYDWVMSNRGNMTSDMTFCVWITVLNMCATHTKYTFLIKTQYSDKTGTEKTKTRKLCCISAWKISHC